MELHARPLAVFPGKLRNDKDRRPGAPFKTRFDQSVNKLKAELRRMGATTAVIQADFSERDIAASTGFFRGDRAPGGPAVVVIADTENGTLRFACDLFRDWRQNVHAIALTMERIRLSNLYEVTSGHGGEQWRGWKMLPGPITLGSGGSQKDEMSLEEAGRVLIEQAARSGLGVSMQTLMSDMAQYRLAYRQAAKVAHPDHPGGSAESWQRVEKAAQLFDAFYSRR